ncbi:hypothetical protein WMY93_014180 [Mugilogobius chulae]|uniref:Fibrinogen C-terminal domain-containing protein n=1 Tax=Mugilogobius chulae TaxID=88201 RepID=A0AAW0NTR3_9GOBI
MKVYALLLLWICSAAAQVDPRGARPVVPNTRSEKCATQKEWPFCTDEEWGPKCPSGCRMQGLLENYDHGFLKRVERIRGLLDQSTNKHRSADQVSRQTFDFLREKLTIDSGNDNNYFDMAQTLRQRITEMKIKIDQQLQVLGALKERVKEQVADMQKLEVDIDMKLRTCKGSCKTYNSYSVDHEEYVALEKQMNQLDTLSNQNIESVGTLHVMKSRPLKDAVVSSIYKSKDAAAQQKTEDMFPQVNTVQLYLEAEGSSSSPATISKVPGTSLSPGTTPSDPSTSHKSITELGGDGGDPFTLGGGFDSLGQPAISTKSVSCTKRIRTVVVNTDDGPVQRMEEYMDGGPECQSFTKGGMGSLFPSLTSGTKTVHFTSSSKGSVVDPAGLDLGAFLTDNAEDDLPDFHARSVKSARVERQADYVGKDCVAAHQFHLNGESNGLFKIQAAATAAVVTVYCQQEGLMGGWLLAQQRETGAVSFNRTWAEYRNGFGNVDAQGSGEFWLVCLRLNQNGPQSLSHDRKRSYCRRKSQPPMCTDHDWTSRCPSGCRIQGLILEHEKKVENKLRNVCKMAKTYEDTAEKSMSTTAKIYHKSRENIINTTALHVRFVKGAEDLTKNLTSLRNQSKSLVVKMTELKENIQKQLEDLLRTEVEVDMRLRSCLGSCQSGFPFSVNLEDYVTLRSQTEQMNNGERKSDDAKLRTIPQIRTSPVDFGPEPSPVYKTLKTVLDEGLNLFEDLRPQRLKLDILDLSELEEN